MNGDAKNIFNLYLEHDETNMANPEEKRELVIGRKIKHLLGSRKGTVEDYREQIQQAIELAEELIKMHGQEEDDEYPMSSSGPTSSSAPQAEPAPHAAPM